MRRSQKNIEGDEVKPTWQRFSERALLLVPVALLVLLALLAAALFVIYRLASAASITDQTLRTLKAENEALMKNISETQTLYLPTRPADDVKCEADWEQHGGKCYRFSAIAASWEDSRAECKRLGGDLVKIESREEQDKMKKMNDSGWFWIGLTDSAEEGKWTWVDGSPLDENLKFWCCHEPDNWGGETSDGEDCARMGRTENVDLKAWFDRECDDPQRIICEK